MFQIFAPENNAISLRVFAFYFNYIERYRDIITGNLREYCGIEDVTVNIHDWVETLSADRYVKLLRTYSGFRGMDDNLRESLNAEIFAAIQNAVGSIQQPYRAILFHAKKATHE